MSVQIVMYHYVRDLKFGRYNNIKGLDVEDFKIQLDFFEKNFNIIKMQDLINAVENKGCLPQKSLLLTFDDGYADHFNTVFPILKNRGLQGSFFIPTRTFCDNTLLDVNKIHFVLASSEIETLYNETIEQIEFYKNEGWNVPEIYELVERYEVPFRFDDAKTIFVKRMLQTVLPEELRRIISSRLFKKHVGLSEDVFARELYMNKEQIICMKEAGMFIGLHGYNHYWFENIPKDEQENEIKKALETAGDFIDYGNWVMNYPYGSYNQDTLDILEKYGCRLALTTKLDSCDINEYGKYELPRLDTNDFPPISENYLKYEVEHEPCI